MERIFQSYILPTSEIDIGFLLVQINILKKEFIFLRKMFCYTCEVSDGHCPLLSLSSLSENIKNISDQKCLHSQTQTLTRSQFFTFL